MAFTQVTPDRAPAAAGPAGGRGDAPTGDAASIEDRQEQLLEDRMRYRLRYQTRPFVAMSLLVAAAGAARAAAHLTGDQADVAATTAGAAFVAAVVVSIVTRRRLSGKRVRRWATICSMAAASWLTWVAHVGLSFDAVSLLGMLTFVLLAWPSGADRSSYWERHRIPDTIANPEPVMPAAEPGMEGYARLWAAFCGGTSNGPLSGSWLTGREMMDNEVGERYVLMLVPGRHTLGDVRTALPKLRSGLHLMPTQDLIVERHPLLNEACVQLTIVTKSQALHQESVDWPGPNYDAANGTIALGPYTDDDGIATWDLYVNNRMRGGALFGATGSGKSRTLDSLGLSMAATDHTVVWFADPQQGASSPLLSKYADYVARGVPGIREMFAMAMLVKELRELENAYLGLEGFVPSAERPGLAILLDECHEAFADPEIQYMATILARAGGKLGIAIIGASQTVTQDTFGTAGRAKDAEALRSSLLAGNLLLFYLESPNAKSILRVDVDPSQFPKIAGYAYRVNRTGKGRAAPLRGYYLRDEIRDYWAERIVWRGLDDGASQHLGSGYLSRKEQAVADREALAAKIAAMREGKRPAPAEAAAATTSTVRPPVPGMPAMPALSTDNVIAFPTWPPKVRPATPEPATEKPVPPILTTERGKRLYDLVCSGVQRFGELQERSGYSETHTRNTLKAIAAAGLITDAGHGKWSARDGATDVDQEADRVA